MRANLQKGYYNQKRSNHANYVGKRDRNFEKPRVLLNWHSFAKSDCGNAGGGMEDPHAEGKVVYQGLEVVWPDHQCG